MKKALLQLNAAVFLWGFTGVLGRAISLQEYALVWNRLLITTLCLWAIFLIQRKAIRMPLQQVLYVAGVGTVQALHWVCFYGSIKWSNVTIALTCLSTSALMAALIEPILTAKKLKPLEVVLGLFTIAGIGLIYKSHLDFSTGIWVGLLSALLTVIVSVLNKKMVNQFAPDQIMLYQLSGGFLGLTVLAPLAVHLLHQPLKVPQGWDWLWLGILSIVCTIFTFMLYIRSLKQVSAFTMNLLLTLEPVYGILLAFILFREDRSLDAGFYLGFALITAAVVVHVALLMRKGKETLTSASEN